jgi:glycosyltransferase involved in cell wall biosynthesis
MKIYLPNISEQSIGGGWTFMRNFKNGMRKFYSDVEFVDKIHEADVMLVSGVTLAKPDELKFAKEHGVKIVFRVDNIPKKSRNKRSRVYDNMHIFSSLADRIVFQSEWAKDYAGYFTGDSPWQIIYNGVDKSIFYPAPEDEFENGLRYLFVQFNRDENKRFPEAAYYFHKRWRQDNRSKLTLVGQFSPELADAKFDFFAGEDVEYLGVISDPNTLAEVYRSHDILLFPAFADAAPNTVLEARACGLAVECVNPVGGTEELLDVNLDISLERMCREYYELFKSLMPPI